MDTDYARLQARQSADYPTGRHRDAGSGKPTASERTGFIEVVKVGTDANVWKPTLDKRSKPLKRKQL